MDKFAKPGEFCPNEGCRDYGNLQRGNLQRFGKTRRGVQRFRCTTCHRTFTETTGTIFFYKHMAEEEILETLALLAEGSRISSLSRAKGHKEDTILEWLREAARHAIERQDGKEQGEQPEGRALARANFPPSDQNRFQPFSSGRGGSSPCATRRTVSIVQPSTGAAPTRV
jgi:transposase-like protein